MKEIVLLDDGNKLTLTSDIAALVHNYQFKRPLTIQNLIQLANNLPHNDVRNARVSFFQLSILSIFSHLDTSFEDKINNFIFLLNSVSKQATDLLSVTFEVINALINIRNNNNLTNILSANECDKLQVFLIDEFIVDNLIANPKLLNAITEKIMSVMMYSFQSSTKKDKLLSVIMSYAIGHIKFVMKHRQWEDIFLYFKNNKKTLSDCLIPYIVNNTVNFVSSWKKVFVPKFCDYFLEDLQINGSKSILRRYNMEFDVIVGLKQAEKFAKEVFDPKVRLTCDSIRTLLFHGYLDDVITNISVKHYLKTSYPLIKLVIQKYPNRFFLWWPIVKQYSPSSDFFEHLYQYVFSQIHIWASTDEIYYISRFVFNQVPINHVLNKAKCLTNLPIEFYVGDYQSELTPEWYVEYFLKTTSQLLIFFGNVCNEISFNILLRILRHPKTKKLLEERKEY